MAEAEKKQQGKPFAKIAEVHRRNTVPQIFPWPVVLLLLAEEPAHGYLLCKKLVDLGLFDEGVDASTIYPSLRAMDEEGFIAAELQEDGPGPARKVFHITEAGRKELEEMSAQLRDVTAAIAYFQKRYKAVAARGAGRGRTRCVAGAGDQKGKAR